MVTLAFKEKLDKEVSLVYQVCLEFQDQLDPRVIEVMLEILANQELVAWVPLAQEVP